MRRSIPSIFVIAMSLGLLFTLKSVASSEVETRTISVRGAEHEKYIGEDMILPASKDWHEDEIPELKIRFEVPSKLERRPLQRYPAKIYKSQFEKGALVLGFYPVFNSWGGLPSIEIELKRYSPQELSEYIQNEKKYMSSSTSTTSAEHIWEKITEHPALDVLDHSWQPRYRKDLSLANGDMLRISAQVHKYFQKKGNRDLFPEMDSEVKRIIDSIRETPSEKKP
ncbi:MAG: hypothetical protein KCHDKBKB_01914 [Elusimicrobia bacterium]|nr:hypothetical protein [Elusimicrobiota bacterium]